MTPGPFRDVQVSFGPDHDGPGTQSEHGVVRMVAAHNMGPCDADDFEHLVRVVSRISDRRPVAITVPEAHQDRLSLTQRMDVEILGDLMVGPGFLPPVFGRRLH